ncbi:phosphoenolpyruvate--protein phosphotransferase [Shewanella sp.]|uniref:phosphoenolpyruvate--protein phosphotransferase n=1 Tax=Shewanella sp. TaxID=50422 RepID=UPI004053E1F1
MPITGTLVSSGIAFGVARLITPPDQCLDGQLIPLDGIDEQQAKLKQAIDQLCQHLRRCQCNFKPEQDTFELIDADIMLLEDPELLSALNQHIRQFRFNAQVAVDRIFTQQADELAQLDDPYLANRSLDIRGLGKRLNSALCGIIELGIANIDEDCIILAQDLTPAEFGQLPLKFVKGLVLATGSVTSHTAILARAADIPTLINCQWQKSSNSATSIKNGDKLVLDAIAGELFYAPSTELQAQFEAKYQQEQQRRQALAQYKARPSETLDGHSVAIRANVGELNDVLRLIDSGAQGVGLFRTEFLLIHAKKVPTEQEQYQLYCDALHSLAGQVLTIRTFDIGADKDMPCVTQAKEDNPALGLRGIRFSLAQPAILQPQLRAVLRAANHGPIRLMFPMLNQLEELELLIAQIELCKTQLLEQEKGFGELSLGIVVETPAAVLNLSNLLPLLDFVSIGSNDLSQYTQAVDRTNAVLTKSFSPLSPPVLKLIAMTVESCKAFNKTLSLCGELASDPKLTPLLVGLGINELSVNPAQILEVKAALCLGKFSGAKGFYAHGLDALAKYRITDLEQCVKNYNNH